MGVNRPSVSRPSVKAFKSAITEAKKPVGKETAGKVTGTEMKKALEKLPGTDAGVKAAQDLLGSDVKMNAAAKKALQGFIEKELGTTPERPGTGVRTFDSVKELKTALKQNPDFAEDVFTAAFGSTRSRSSSAEIGTIRKNGDGFDVDVSLVHWRTRALMKEDTIHISKAGVISGGSGGAGDVAGPARPDSAALDAVKSAFEDTGHARRFAELALDAAGMRGLTRSDAVHVGDVTAGPMGSVFVDVQISHFMRRDDVRADLRLQLDPRGELMGAFERPGDVATPDPVAPSPSPGTSGADAIAEQLKDTGAARSLAQKTLEDLGLGGLTRSDGVHIGDVTPGPMGSFFVDLKIAHFMRPDDVRADARVQVNGRGEFIGAAERD